MTDIIEEVVQEEDPLDVVVRKIFTHNLVLILVAVGGAIGAGIGAGVCCRFCFLCPLHRRKLHERRLKSMEYGLRV